MTTQAPTAQKDYSPTGNQQQPAVPKPIDAPDDQPISSAGNQAIKAAVEHLHPKDLVRNLDPEQPAVDPATDHDASSFDSTPPAQTPKTARGADST